MAYERKNSLFSNIVNPPPPSPNGALDSPLGAVQFWKPYFSILCTFWFFPASKIRNSGIRRKSSSRHWWQKKLSFRNYIIGKIVDFSFNFNIILFVYDAIRCDKIRNSLLLFFNNVSRKGRLMKWTRWFTIDLVHH